MPACATPVRVAVSLVVVVSLFASLGLCAAGEQDISGAVCSSAAAARTASASALNEAGVALRLSERIDDAIACFEAALVVDASFWIARSNLASLTLMLGDARHALEHALRAASEADRADAGLMHAHAYVVRAWILLGELDRIEPFVREHLLRAADPEPLLELATAVRRRRILPDLALECFERVLNMPTCGAACRAAAFDGAGNVFQAHRDFEQANAYFALATRHDPACAFCWHNWGNTYALERRFADALPYYKAAIAVDPAFHMARAFVGFFENHICEWSNRTRNLADVHRVVAEQLALGVKPDLYPYQLHEFPLAPAFLRGVMDAHAASFVAQAAPFRAEVRAAWSEVVRARGGRARVLHVGFLSTGFGMHVRSHLSVHMFHELATRHATRVHTHCFALNGDDGTIARERIERYCNEFVVVEGLGDLEIARTIAARGLDVFVEFNGYWQYRTLDPTPRVQIAAYRVAPVQMSILTWASTFGRGLLDYFVGDRVAVAPDVARAGFGERIIVAPGTYQVNSVRHTYADLPCPTPRDGSAPRFVTETQYWPRAVMRSERGGAAFTSDAAVTMTRELFGLPDDALVFCDFNVLYKVDPGIFGVWMRLLRRHRGSVLWMGDNPVEAMERLRREAEARGVDPARLVFSERAATSEFLTRQQLCDVHLDTAMYNAHATGTDLLWSGVPVVTRMGRRMSNRVAASLVRALHPLLEAVLVARTNAEYELLADQLASCDAQRVRLRGLLCALRERAPLFDTKLWTGNWLRGVSMAADLERRRPTGWRSSAHVVVRDERAAGARLAHTLAAEWHATLRAGPASGWLRSCAVLDRVLDAVSADLARLG